MYQRVRLRQRWRVQSNANPHSQQGDRENQVLHCESHQAETKAKREKTEKSLVGRSKISVEEGRVEE